MSADEVKAAKRSAPRPNTTTAAEARILLFPTSTTHASYALPSHWSAKYVTVRAIDQDLKFSVSTGLAGQEVDYTLAAAADGQANDPTLGKLVVAGTAEDYQMPEVKQGDTMYFNVEAAGSGSVELVLSSP